MIEIPLTGVRYRETVLNWNQGFIEKLAFSLLIFKVNYIAGILCCRAAV